MSLGFFNDIYILRSLLPPNCAYDDHENRFFWYPGDDGPPLDEAGLQNTLKAGEFEV